MERTSHAEYVASIRSQAGRLASAALARQVELLEACHELSALLARSDLSPDDPDAMVFSLICCETETLPIGAIRAHWAPGALESAQSEIDSAVMWATPLALPAFKSVAHRFGA